MLKIDGYVIYFSHKPDEWGYTNSIGDGGTIETPYKGKTECFVKQQDADGNLVTVAEASAFCSAAEKFFNKSTGRKISLAKVLKSFPKEFRTRVWNEYLATVKK